MKIWVMNKMIILKNKENSEGDEIYDDNERRRREQVKKNDGG